MLFNVNDRAVYPAHGVGTIRGIETREIAGKRQTFYILKVLDTGMTIMVPTNNAQSIGMRAIISKDAVESVYDVLREKDVHIENQTWNRRYREYMSKIKTGSLIEVAKVARDLSLLKNEKPLSFGERKMLDTAMNLLVKEIAVALDTTEEAVREKVSSIFRERQSYQRPPVQSKQTAQSTAVA